ncbi:snare associated Golgi protein-domain-containing protein [Gloeopeniophorella convolvens]|nr:snare associated Golgi protein-domain-containing protein [Gloeopeniophorella convolvens]
MSSPYPAYGRPQPGANPYMYPPNGNPYTFNNSSSSVPPKPESSPERISRTPSPTPSEAAELSRQGVLDWKTLSHWRFWVRREWLWYYVLAFVLTLITALITIFHTQIVKALTPEANKIKNLPGGWAIPIAILFVISFPPLFGHEIIAILCGVVWGLWIGFAIVAAGTFVGELGNFYAFKYCCRARGEKTEKTNIQYGCLARIVREGGFKIAVIARSSAIPGHFTTAVFATCGMSVWTFSLAAFLTLPKQFVTVYIGVILETSGKSETTGQRVASYTVIAVTTIITILAAWYIYREMGRVKPAVIYDRRKARQAKMEYTGAYYNNASTVSAFRSNPSDSDVTLQPYDPEGGLGSEESVHQQWDEYGRAVGYAPDPQLHAPRPRQPSFTPSARYAPPASAAAATATMAASGDEWSNARTPRTPTASAPAPPRIHVSQPSSPVPQHVPYNTSPLSFAPPAPFPPAPRSPPASASAQYVTYQPEQFASMPGSTSVGRANTLPTPPFHGTPAQTPYAPPLAPAQRAFTPPPSYRSGS